VQLLIFPFFSLKFLILNALQSGNDISAGGAGAIADAMRLNSSLQRLDLVRLCC
jgi:hypothetical protein